MIRPNYPIKPGLFYIVNYDSYTVFKTSKPLMKNGNFLDLKCGDVFMVIKGLRRRNMVMILSKYGINWMLDTIFYDGGYDSPPLEAQ